MLEGKAVADSLQNAVCYKCGASLSGAKFVSVSQAPTAILAHAVCPVCSAESMLTVTSVGSGIRPVVSDLMEDEFKKFVDKKPVTYDNLFDLHLALEKENIWSLLQKKEKKLENKLKK